LLPASLRADASLGGRLREPDRGVKQASRDRVAEVGSAHPSQGGAHVVEVEQVTYNDFGSFGRELPGTVVLLVHESAYAVPALQQEAHGGLAGVSCCASDQEQTVVVHQQA
jgi:hypothetical protein